MMGANGTGQNTQPGTGGATTMGSGGSHAGTGGAMAPSATSGGGSGAAGNSPADGGTTDGMMPPGMSTEPKLPEAKGDCPDLSSGFVTINGSSVQTWTGMKQEKKAPLVIYWHVTGGSSGEMTTFGLNQDAVDEITGEGGVIAAPNNSTGMGNDTGNGVWYTGDFDVADQIVACAMQQYNIDPHQIYTAGGSAGALQAGIMVYQRSSYLAASLPNSGGYTIGGNMLQDPTHVPAVMTEHGAAGVDVVIVDFSVQSMVLDVDVAMKGGFAIDCNHGGGHVGAPPDLKAAGWQFLKDHPFGVKPEPYANGLPSTFPSYCTVVKATDMAPDGCCKNFGQPTMNGTGGM